MKRLATLTLLWLGLAGSVRAAFPAVESVTGTGFASAATSHSVAMPATVAAGDLLLMAIAIDNASARTVTATDWTDIGSTTRVYLLAKVAAGTEGGTNVSVSLSDSHPAAVHVIRISGWYGDLAGVESATATSGTGTQNPPSLTPSWGSADTLWVAIVGSANDDATVSSYPASYSDGSNTVSGGGTDAGCNVGSCWRQNAASSEDPGSFSLSFGQTGRTYTIGVRPGAAAPTFTPRVIFIGRLMRQLDTLAQFRKDARCSAPSFALAP